MVQEATGDIHKLVWPEGESRVFSWLDRAKPIVDLVLPVGTAYAGFQAMKHPMGAVYGLLGLRLAQTDGLFSNAAGLAILAHIGLSNIAPNTSNPNIEELTRIDPADPKIPAIPVPGPGGAGMAGVVPIQEVNPYIAGRDLIGGRYFPF